MIRVLICRCSGLSRLARGFAPPPLPEGLHRTNLSVIGGSAPKSGSQSERSEAEIALSLPVPPLTPLPSPGAHSQAPPTFPSTPTPSSTPTPMLLPGNIRADSPAVQQCVFIDFMKKMFYRNSDFLNFWFFFSKIHIVMMLWIVRMCMVRFR